MQRFENVELSVLRVLHEQLKPSLVPTSSPGDYASFDIDPSVYSTRESFIRDYAFSSFLRKWKGLEDPSLKPRETALRTWLEAEKQCFRTNVRLEHETSTGLYTVAPRIISDAQRKISQILGPLDFERIAVLCRFGNGATYDLRRGATHAEKSLSPSITFSAIPWVCRSLAGDDYLGHLVGGFSDLKIVDSNRMVMVPKTAKTHRSIAAEPTLNSYVQQGVGRYIRMRLKRFGVDLDDQTINQDLARIGLEWGLSTLDLSSASDTLCTNLVKLLLPPSWYEVLDDLRCKFTEYGGRRFKTSKFSSMGNSYTFELESLIFYALVSSACTVGVTSVYGDDIIVHNQDYSATLQILEWAGFQVNVRKSHTEGSRFRESCGKHYFDGREVTPCFQKDVCTRPHDYVRLHNRLVRAGIRLGLRNEFQEAARLVRRLCRSSFGVDTPGVGPLVEYDEYFIREDFVWGSPLEDRVKIRSAVTRNRIKKCGHDFQHIAYYGRKLRVPGFLNPDPSGQASESRGSKLVIIDKYHWRSATLQ